MPARALLLLALFTTTVRAADPIPLAKEAYLTPPKEIADAVLATQTAPTTLTNLSPDGKRFVVVKTDTLPPLERLACPTVHLAELAIDPVATRTRDLWVRSAKGFDLFDHATRKSTPVEVPEKARVSSPVWSPDGKSLAFFAHFAEATYVYVADAETGKSRRVTATPVLATLATNFQWSRDGKRIMAVMRPGDGRAEYPKPAAVATEPKVRIARDGKDPSRTFRYLLESPYDAQLLEYLVTGQLATINVADGKATKVGNPRLIRAINMAADGDQFRVTTVKKPFSYYFPFPRFGSLEEVWGADGKTFVVLADQNLRETEQPAAVAAAPTGSGRTGGTRSGGSRPATSPPADPMAADPPPAGNTPPDPTNPDPTNPIPDPNVDPNAPRRATAPADPADPDGKRDLSWRPDGAGLSYLQLTPAAGGNDSARKDRVQLWVAPFGKADVKTVYEAAGRISAVQYAEDGKWLFLTQTADNIRTITAVDLKDTKKTFVVYKSNGSPEPKPDVKPAGEQVPRTGGGFRSAFSGGVVLLTHAASTGGSVVRVSKAGDVYLTGSERSTGPTAPYARPYLDKVSITTGKKERLFEGKGETFETIDAVDASDVTAVFTTRQKPDVVPDSYKTEVPKGTTTKLTDNVDPSAWHHKLKIERIRVTRADGFKFWVKVTLPPDAAKKLPAMFWIYPREYTDQAAYDSTVGRTTATSGRFAVPSARSMSLLTLLGYAVVEPDVPIVGPVGRMNDNYVADLRNSLWAVIDELDKRGVIDRDRLACGGHSYGAFSTANALAHTPFFKAGIAGDGNYNRTLTTMTFQAERRLLWDARETYLEMSPLLWANRINGALLMYHGMEDANVGTDPVNAEHLFMALDGLGKPAALYMYPYEAHGPISRETTLDLWARWVGWLDKYVKNAKRE